MYQNCNILWNEKNPHPLFLSLKEPCVQQIYCILEILKMEFLEKQDFLWAADGPLQSKIVLRLHYGDKWKSFFNITIIQIQI